MVQNAACEVLARTLRVFQRGLHACRGITYLEFELTDAATPHPELARLVGTGSLLALSDNKNIGGHGGGHLHLGASLRVPEDWVRPSGVDWAVRTPPGPPCWSSSPTGPRD